MNQFTPLTDRITNQCRPDPITGCWVWTGYKPADPQVRPRVKYKGKYTSASRVAWEAFRGMIPNNLWVLHKCDNPACVNPDHLFLGTHADNMQDAIEKGRHTTQAHPEVCRANARRLGLRNTWSKGRVGKSIIPHADIPKIRARRAAGESLVAVGKTYGVSGQAVHKFLKREVIRAAIRLAQS